MPLKILIADDHAVVRDGLKMILSSAGDMDVVGTATDGRDAISKAEALQPDVIVMDIAMPGLNGIEATRVICSRLASVKVIILSMHHTHEHVIRAFRAGARGFILKESAGADVVKAVRAVKQGLHFFGNGVDKPADAFLSEGHDVPKSPLESLSLREREVLQLVVEGKTSAEIAELLSLSPKSIETYRSRLMQKLGIKNIPDLVKFAIQQGITPIK